MHIEKCLLNIETQKLVMGLGKRPNEWYKTQSGVGYNKWEVKKWIQ